MMSYADQLQQLSRLPAPARWLIATRLKTVGLSLTPVLCGTWIAHQAGHVNALLALLAAFSAIAIQVGTNLWNDAADAARGTDTHERLGPPRMTALGLLDAAAVRRAAFLTYAAAFLAGIPLVAAGGWPIIAIGLCSLLLGYTYSLGPLPLSHTPLGELFVIIFFGIIAVTGTAHVLGADLSPAGLWAGLMLGLPSSAVLLINNHRDRKTDEAAGRRTLAILIGEPGVRVLYAVLMLGALPILYGLVPHSPLTWLLLAADFIAALMLVRGIWRTPISTAINRFLPQTVLYQFLLLLTLVTASAVA